MRDILLDTHIFLWSQFELGKLSAELRRLFEQTDIRWHVSQVSFLEIEIKYGLGKLPLPLPPARILPKLIEESGFCFHVLSNDAIFMLGKLPSAHRDPFDRLLVASALTRGWEIATVDPQFDAYPVRTVH